MNWFTAFVNRLSSETPSFFKKIIWFGGIVGSIGAALIAAKETATIPVWLLDQADNMVLIGVVAAIVAKAAVKSNDDLAQ